VKQIVEESYARAKSVLKQNLKGLTELAELLLEKEVIFSEDLERIFGKRKADILKEMREAEEKKTQSAEAAKTKTENDPAEQLSATEDAPQKEQSKNTTKQEKLFPDTNTVDSEEQAKQSTE
jgi:cell division protease FtsH